MAENNLVIIGYGSHAISILSAVSHLEYEVIGYVDKSQTLENPFHLFYLGTDEDYLTSNKKNQALHICGIGDNKQRKTIQEKYESEGFTFTNIIHPKSCIEDLVEMGKGIFVGAFAYINGLSKISDGVIVNNHVNIDHGCKVWSYVHLAPCASLAGSVEIDVLALIGTGAAIIPAHILDIMQLLELAPL